VKSLPTESFPIWLAIAMCFAIPIYAQILWGGPADDLGVIEWVLVTVLLSAWLSMPQILAVLFMFKNPSTAARWVLLVVSVVSIIYVGDVIRFPFPTASSMATAHVFAPLYAAIGVAAGGATILGVQGLIRRTK
jgi:hypothetical protein